MPAIKPFVTVETRKCFKCGEQGHLVKNCPVKAKIAEKKCYRCGNTGHIAKVCPTKCTSYAKSKHNAKNGGTKKPKFVKGKNDVHATVKVTSNGNGISTCDRVVRKGEVTRTGLII